MKSLRSYVYYKLFFPIGDLVVKTKLSYYYRKIKMMQNLSGKDIINWQNQQLRILLTHAYCHTTYYKELLDSLGLKPNDFSSKEDLNRLPPLTKEIIINNFHKFIPDNISKISHKEAFTGGSTGKPLKYLLDNRSWSFSTANTLINRENNGWYIGDKHIVLGSSSLNISSKQSIKHKIYYLLKGKISLSGVNLSDSVCNKYINIIMSKKIRHIYGYASSIYLLADYALRNKLNIKLDGCYTTSEKLTDIFRQTITEAFKCKILDEYGANDGGITAFNYGDGRFLVSYNSLFNCPDAEHFSLLLTDLTNHAFPLINYDLGDQVSCQENHSFRHNYNGQVFTSLLGRTSDIIQLENGSNITGPGFTVLFNSFPVEYYCVKKEGVNHIKCFIKKRNDFNLEHEAILKKNIAAQIGDAQLDIEYSDKVFFTKSGKRAYFIK
ncbi:MAG: hypothetical protein Q8S18_12865 [Bacteroidales bacterium]|nr:hypothetical protein [Bacteroidales bacterium]